MSDEEPVNLYETLKSLKARVKFLMSADWPLPDKYERVKRLWEGIARVQEEIDQQNMDWRKVGF